MFKKTTSLIVSFSLLLTQPILAQGAAELNIGKYLSQMPVLNRDSFRPPHLRYISYDLKSNDFKLLLDQGDAKLSNSQNSLTPKLQDATQELFNYFLIGLSLPNEKFWVNLRPDAPEQIIDPELEKTDMGKIMLEADLQLKKDTAGWTSLQNPEGKEYWDKLYKKAGELFGTENITIPTITRPWIVPGEVIIRESEDSSYIYKANLKVMLEEDYLTGKGEQSFALTFSDPRMKELNKYSTQLIKELILPKLTQEINTSKRYAQLRQIFFSLILSRWFKDKYKGKPGQYSSRIDSHNLDKLTSKEGWNKEYYFNEYKKSFQQGEYNLKEQVSTPTGQAIRSYVSGGIRPVPEKIDSFAGSPLIDGRFKATGEKILPYMLASAMFLFPIGINEKGNIAMDNQVAEAQFGNPFDFSDPTNLINSLSPLSTFSSLKDLLSEENETAEKAYQHLIKMPFTGSEAHNMAKWLILAVDSKDIKATEQAYAAIVFLCQNFSFDSEDIVNLLFNHIRIYYSNMSFKFPILPLTFSTPENAYPLSKYALAALKATLQKFKNPDPKTGDFWHNKTLVLMHNFVKENKDVIFGKRNDAPAYSVYRAILDVLKVTSRFGGSSPLNSNITLLRNSSPLTQQEAENRFNQITADYQASIDSLIKKVGKEAANWSAKKLLTQSLELYRKFIADREQKYQASGRSLAMMGIIVVDMISDADVYIQDVTTQIKDKQDLNKEKAKAVFQDCKEAMEKLAQELKNLDQDISAALYPEEEQKVGSSPLNSEEIGQLLEEHFKANNQPDNRAAAASSIEASKEIIDKIWDIASRIKSHFGWYYYADSVHGALYGYYGPRTRSYDRWISALDEIKNFLAVMPKDNDEEFITGILTECNDALDRISVLSGKHFYDDRLKPYFPSDMTLKRSKNQLDTISVQVNNVKSNFYKRFPFNKQALIRIMENYDDTSWPAFVSSLKKAIKENKERGFKQNMRNYYAKYNSITEIEKDIEGYKIHSVALGLMYYYNDTYEIKNIDASLTAIEEYFKNRENIAARQEDSVVLKPSDSLPREIRYALTQAIKKAEAKMPGWKNWASRNILEFQQKLEQSVSPRKTIDDVTDKRISQLLHIFLRSMMRHKKFADYFKHLSRGDLERYRVEGDASDTLPIDGAAFSRIMNMLPYDFKIALETEIINVLSGEKAALPEFLGAIWQLYCHRLVSEFIDEYKSNENIGRNLLIVMAREFFDYDTDSQIFKEVVRALRENKVNEYLENNISIGANGVSAIEEHLAMAYEHYLDGGGRVSSPLTEEYKRSSSSLEQSKKYKEELKGIADILEKQKTLNDKGKYFIEGILDDAEDRDLGGVIIWAADSMIDALSEKSPRSAEDEKLIERLKDIREKTENFSIEDDTKAPIGAGIGSATIEQYKELIEQVFSNYESGGRKLPEYLQTARDEIQGLFSHSSLYRLLTDTANLIKKDTHRLESMRDIYLALINSAQAMKNEIFDSPYRPPDSSATPTPEDKTSSALAATAPTKTGGIDFRQMNILTKPTGSFSGLNFNLPMLSKAELESLDMDKELTDIQKMVNSGIVPSGNRLKEYLLACYQKGELNSHRKNIIVSLAEICNLEESLVKESDPGLREALVMAEWIEA